MNIYQRTVAGTVGIEGIGMHSGRPVSLVVKPAPPNNGIRFIRTDLPNRPGVRAHFNRVVDTSLATVLGCDGFIVSTIEHIMATFAGLGIDNAFVEISAYELPILDGSAADYARLFTSVGIVDQDHPRYFFLVKEPIEYRNGDRSIALYPDDEFRITYTIAYDHPVLKTQTLCLPVNSETFVREISPARTYGFFHEVEYLKKYGFARGGSLDNAVVIGEDGVLNEDGLRFEDEFVRHKILDCIGDLSLLGMPIIGHVIAKKAGHSFNHAFLKTFFERKDAWETTTFCTATAH